MTRSADTGKPKRKGKRKTDLATVNAEPRELSRVLECRRLLAEAKTFDDVLKIRDQAEAIRVCLRMRDASLEAQNDAAEMKVRAERRLGQLLEPKIGRPEKVSRDGTLSDLGISRNMSSRCQAIARIDEYAFENQIAEMRADGKEITSVAFWRTAAKEDVPADPKPWSLHENMERLNEKIYSVYEDWPPEKHGILAVRLIDIGNELRDKGELCEHH
jgi:hypothetical protein